MIEYISQVRERLKTMKRKRNNFSDVKVDSKWEAKLVEGVMKECLYHPRPLKYTKPATEHTYHPDFATQTLTGCVIVEAKGRFREAAEMKKYIHIRTMLENSGTMIDSTGLELVFLFMKPNTPLPNAKKRKDGTKRTHAEWAEKNNFRWFTEDTIGELLK